MYQFPASTVAEQHLLSLLPARQSACSVLVRLLFLLLGFLYSNDSQLLHMC